MCHPYAPQSDVQTLPCPMCRVFKPSAARCPHLRDVCYNRANHPRTDVVHLRNAEVKSFNGCGFCKWARANPKLSVYANGGWPGCCRAPAPAEYRLVQPADWPTVSIVHNIPIPPEIKSVLDAVLSRASPRPPPPPPPALDRRNTTTATPRPPCASPARSVPVPVPARGRSGGSPQPASTPRAAAPLADHPLARRQTYTEGTKDRPRAPSARRHEDTSLARRSTARPSLAAVGDARPPADADRLALETAMAALEIGSTSGSSSDSGSSRGSLSDATVISDGAFTDYLSDESEAELQRQAEAKAALVAQNQAEELEFKAARQQLAGVGLRPPKAWDDTNERAGYVYHPAAYAARG